MKLENKPQKAYNPTRSLDWYLIAVAVGVTAFESFKHFCLKPQNTKLREAQKIVREEKEEREENYRLRAYDPKDVYGTNRIYEPNLEG